MQLLGESLTIGKPITEHTEAKASLYFEYPAYKVRRAPELDGSRSHHKVLIVGAGPVGMACALDLANRGIATTIVEAEETVGYGSRAGSISRHSLQLLERLGVLDELLGIGLSYEGGWTYYRDKKVFEFSMSGEQHRLPPMLKIQQCYVERALANRLEAHPLVDFRWGTRAIAIHQDDDSVRLELHSQHGNYAIEAEYVVASDGARSFVRRALDLTLQGVTYPATFIVADIQMESDGDVGRRVWFAPPCNPSGSVIMHRQPQNIWRFDYQVPYEVSDEPREIQMDEESVHDRIQEHLDWIGETGEWQIDWLTLYRAHGRRLESLHHGRVLFVGDAGHLVPIFGVRGLNSGFADAANLSWKLQRVISEISPPSLLTTYAEERGYAADMNIHEADKSTRFMSPRGAGARALRDAALRLAVEHSFVRPLLNPRQSLPIDYPASSLNTHFDSGTHPDGSRPDKAVGRVIPDTIVRSSNSTHLYEVLGNNFCLLRLDGKSSVQPAVGERVVGREPVREISLASTAFNSNSFTALNGCELLIRPDMHIAYIGQAGDGISLQRAFERATRNPVGNR